MSPDSIKAKLVRRLLDNGVLVSQEILDVVSEENFDQILTRYHSKQGVITAAALVTSSITPAASANDVVYDRTQQYQASSHTTETATGHPLVSIVSADGSGARTGPDIYRQSDRKVKVLFNYVEEQGKKEVQNFVDYFNRRFEAIRDILSARPDLANLMSISKILSKKDKEVVSTIGLVLTKSQTKAGNIMIKLEDTTGIISIIVNKTKQEVYELAKNLVEDEVIGVSGFNDERVIFCNKLLHPDINFNKELKKSPTEEYAIFLSDVHVGSIQFLEDKFLKFLKWLHGEVGGEDQKVIVSKIKYIFIAGDMVDGVGVYPNQEDELNIKDIYKQYSVFTEYIKMIPEHMTIIICPGNHDAVRLSEPQPGIEKEFIAELLSLPNIIMLSNPCIVNIGAEEGFCGFDILMYHGYSFDYYISNVDQIRNNGGYNRADLVMKFLLQRRHLAPTHASSLYIPDQKIDPLVISKAPDFFVTGHIHKTALASYRNITLISGSCWQSTTPFQEKVGHNPEPARVPLVNLQTREAKILRF